MKHIILFSSILSILVGCDNSQERKDQENVQAQQEQYSIAQPLPKFDYSLERDVATQLYKASIHPLPAATLS